MPVGEMPRIAASQGPLAVFLDDGELADVRAALRDLGVEHCNARDARLGVRVPLLLSTPAAARALAEGTLDAPLHQLHVVVGEKGERRAPCDFQLHRPIEAAVLRLLTRRAGYGGPERRRVGRVVLGIPVKVRVNGADGLGGVDGEEREVILAQISIGGCGLVSRTPLAKGARLEIAVPPELTTPRDLALSGRVLAAREASTADGPTFDVSVAFDELDLVDRVTLRALMAGQALDRAPRGAAPGAGAGQGPVHERRHALPPGGDRRRTPRRRFHRHVMGERDGIAHVLAARDLSVHGMRIERDESLRLEDRLRLALYAGADAAPILVEATVHRDDGPHGLFLAFDTLEPARAEKLLCLLGTLAPLELDDALGKVV